MSGDATVEFDAMAVEPEYQPGVELEPAAEPAFPLVRRGYDPDSVHAYLEQLEHELAVAREGASTDAAVRRELERVGEETAGILKLAHEKADALGQRARVEADEVRRQAERDAAAARAGAEQRVRQLDADAEAIWQERHRLIQDTRRLADRLLSIADEAVERFPPEEPEGVATVRRASPASAAGGAAPGAAEPVGAHTVPVEDAV